MNKKLSVAVVALALVAGAAGCAPGPATKGWLLMLERFRSAGCEGRAGGALAPAERPQVTGPNCGGELDGCGSGPLRVMTFNVLCSVCFGQERDAWHERVPHLRDTLERYQPDLIGLQELSTIYSVIDVMPNNMPYAALFLEAAPLTYADSTILYRTDRFELLDTGIFWLGPMPCSPSMGAWEGAMLRYLNWAHLRQLDNGFEFLFVCSHFDAGPNKVLSARVASEWLAPAAEALPIIFVGDFNSRPDSEGYQILQGGLGAPMRFENVFDFAAQRELARNTAEGGRDLTDQDGYLMQAGLIDHIFVAGPVEPTVTYWAHDQYVYGPNQLPCSDHFAVIADIELAVKP